MKTDTKMPLLFIGHGSPMNAIEQNAFSRRLNDLGKILPKPRAILCISAHWLTAGSWVTHMAWPKTIHDFYGFPPALFAVDYPAPGSPELAQTLHALIKKPAIHLDEHWGLDHGSWSVIKHLYPKANIPIVQLSIDMSEDPHYHFELGKQLKALRHQGVLLLGSGNIVHNLRMLRHSGQTPYPWALEFDKQVKERLLANDFEPLKEQLLLTESGRLSVPTLDHYLPLLYILGAAEPEEKMRFEFEGIELGAISMRSLSFGL